MKIKNLRKSSMGFVEGKDEFVCNFQNVDDIKKQLRRAEYNSRGFAKKLKPFFVSDDKKKVCKRVWAFLRVYIKYKAEPKERQTAKTIPVFFVQQTGDCKHYATTSVGILKACGIPAFFSIVRQTGDKTKWHVYATALIDNKQIVVDPCRKRFNDECSYRKKYNVAPIN